MLLVQHAIKYISFQNFQNNLKKHHVPNEENRWFSFPLQNSVNPVIRCFAHNEKGLPSTNGEKYRTNPNIDMIPRCNNRRRLIKPSSKN